VNGIWGENGRQTLGPQRDCRKRVVVGKGSHHYIAGGKIGELCGSASPGQRRCSLRVSVIDQYLMTVFDKIDGKSMSHMAETDHTDASDHEFGGSGRFARIRGRCGHEAPRWQESGKARVVRLVESRE
jgi:hypothetical protein